MAPDDAVIRVPMVDHPGWAHIVFETGFGRYWEIVGKHCRISLELRPAYCDRGRFVAKIDILPRTSPLELNLDWADGWPRYYFDFDRAVLEIEAWLKNRKEYVEPMKSETRASNPAPSAPKADVAPRDSFP